MDWFTWLSKTGLEPATVYEYGLAFAQNELEEEDIAYLNHEFLQSMGISIAKHRLEILKLARREKSHGLIKHPMAKFLLILKKTKKSLANYIATLVHKSSSDGSRALIVFPHKKSTKMNNKNNNRLGGAMSYSSRWKRGMMIRSNKKLVMVNYSSNNNHHQEGLMLTNGGDYLGDDPLVVSTPRLESFSSPLMYDLHHDHDHDLDHDQTKEQIKAPDDQNIDDDDEYWSPALEEIRWDAMFQDLKPT